MVAIHRVEVTGTGRVFCVGELAGQFKGLQKLLTSVDFRPSRDRLVLLGNFLGFTPESIHAIQWLQKPWVLALAGPHEAMILSKLNGEPAQSLVGQWTSTMSAAQLDRLRSQLQGLPVAFEMQAGSLLCVATHFLLPSRGTWADIKSKIISSNGTMLNLLAMFGSRLDIARAIGLMGAMQSWCVPDIHLNISSLAVEKPPRVCGKSGNRIILFSSARINHGSVFDRPALLPFIELNSLIDVQQRSSSWQGLVETLRNS